MKPVFKLFLISSVLAFSVGCQSVYYSTMEQFGVHKRDILVDRVEVAKESQEEAKQQFENALEEFIAVTQYQGGALEDHYRELNDELKASEASAADVRERIASIQEVAIALFSEWESELSQYSNKQLRRVSAQQLELTRERYRKLIAVMQRAESKMGPVLDAFRDQVLFLKHNLNARAIAALERNTGVIKADIEALIAQMESSINEANTFIEQMRVPEK